jgi:alkylhydroperoxidase/carboxymuconolactone decarboxylase family protein YurZ
MGPEEPLEAVLRELAAGRSDQLEPETGGLDHRTKGLVGIGAAVSLGASTTTYRQLVQEARDGGATAIECISAFVAAAPVAGSVRIATGAPRLASALGYDVDEELE